MYMGGNMPQPPYGNMQPSMNYNPYDQPQNQGEYKDFSGFPNRK
jgi:hypothetical protein